MKRLVLAITFFLFAATMFAHTGIMWGEKDIKYVSTEHFDIIYEPDCTASAELLYENAERILQEVQEFFGAGDLSIRVPVVLSANNQMFNALCGYVPYTYINIYDTAIDENMAVFSNDLLSTFKHELTHAYTVNMKNKFWLGFTNIFSNVYNPANLFVTSGMAESATLTSESSTGEGRLNDEWSKQITRQAKIENKFPSYYDEQGLSTKYYSGDYYYFNGEFAKYLQQTYGMEKYAQFWYRCVNFKNVSTATAFKKVYGIRIWKAWKNFRDALEVPEYSEPFETDGIKDFFSGSEKKYSLENNQGAIYKNLSVAENGLFYLEYKTGNVYFASNENLEKSKSTGKKITPKKIFQKSSITNISVSSDGKFIAYDYYDSNSANYKYCVGIYDVEKKRHIKESDHFKTSAIITTEDGHYLLTLNFKSQMKQIFVQKISGAWEESYAIQLPDGVTVLSITDIGNGKFAMIVKSGMTWELCFGKIGEQDESNFEKVELPEENMTMRYLSYSASDNSLYFSWTKPDSMPRIGKYSIVEKQFTLADKNISGGVYYPVRLSTNATTGETENIFYIGKFTKQNRIFSYTSPSEFFLTDGKTATAEFATKDFTEIPSDVITLQNPIFTLPESPDSKPIQTDALSDAKKYNPLKYYAHPIIIPFGLQQNFPLGVSFISFNPWGAGMASLSAGYGIESKSFALSAEYQDGTATDLFLYDISALAEFDKDGFKRTIVSASAKLNFDYASIFSAGDVSYIHHTSTSDEKLFFTGTKLGVAVGRIVPYSCELFNYIGGKVTTMLYNDYLKSFESQKTILNSFQIGLKFDFYVPKLLPLKCYDRFVYNLPTTISTSAFYSGVDIFTGTLSSTLFGYDIQKGIPYLFFNRIYVDAGYQFAFKYTKTTENWEIINIGNHLSSLVKNELPYTDKIFVNITTVLTPNIGLVKATLDLTLGAYYVPHRFLESENDWGFSVGGTLSL